ncbi:anti-sigma factor domain-containing protein [Niallia sp. Krafla_26]|uniref:anti-sigma factor domain-containing protein n=1 Tax=Niallia sp. Krafla_26 TaxID=3064703 RepID=UPI003D18761B
MRNGIIMEINRDFLTILTPEGEFLKAQKRNQSYQIGQEVSFWPVEEKKKKRMIFSLPGKIALSACAFALILLSLLPIYQSHQVYAYMSIDVNPSIELSLNKELEVIELTPYNDDGEKIIHALSDWKRKDVDEVTLSILNEMKKQGYTENHHEVVLSTVIIKEQSKEQDQSLQNEMAFIEKKIANDDLDLIVVEASEQDRNDALQKGVTTGSFKAKSSKEDKKKIERVNHSNVESPKPAEKTQIEYEQKEELKPNKKNDSTALPEQAKQKDKNSPQEKPKQTEKSTPPSPSFNEEQKESKQEEKEQKQKEKQVHQEQKPTNNRNNQKNIDNPNREKNNKDNKENPKTN